jgi:Flp pilus assembly protein TadD
MTLGPALPDAPYTLGVVLWQTGRPDEAADAFREAIRRRPQYDEAHYMLGTVLRQLGDADGALAEFRETIRLRPSSAEAQLSLGQLLHERGTKVEADAAFARARALNQQKADVQASTFAVGIGRARMNDGQIAEAIAQFEKALALAPDNFEAHYELARALTRLGRAEDARRHLADARRLAPHVRFRDPE